MAKTLYIALEPITHDGEPIPVGAEVTFDETAAKPLLDWKAIISKKDADAAAAAAEAAAADNDGEEN